MDRIKFVDVLRVFSIFSIIVFHVLYNLGYEDTRWIGFFGVSLFFIVSGYSLKKNYSDHKTFSFDWFFRRVLKFAVLYYLALVLLVLLFGKQIYSGNVFGNLFAHFFFVDFLFPEYTYGIISPAWFLIPFVFMYLLYPFLNKYIGYSKGFLLVAFFLTFVLRFFSGGEVYTSFLPLFFLSDFCAGIAFAKERNAEVLIFSLLMLFVNPFMSVSYFLFYFASRFKWDFFSEKALIFLSSSTLFLFLFHEAVMKVILGKWNVFYLDKFYAVVLLSCLALLCLVLAEWIKRWIFSHWKAFH